MSDRTHLPNLPTHPESKLMTDTVNSAESYYQYRIETDAKIAQMTVISNRLNNELKEMKLQSAIQKETLDPDIGNLIFNLTKGAAIETDNGGFNIGSRTLPEAIEAIRNNESLKRFFSGADIPAPAPKRVFNHGRYY
jgi:hypothetical protein